MERAAITAPKSGTVPLSITRLGFGSAPIGGLFEAVSEEAAFATLQAAWDAGIRYYDTAPLYGFGLSEQRLGAFLRTKPRDEYVLSTKVGRLLRPTRGAGDTGGSLGAFVGALPNDAIFDFGADAVRRSLDESLRRLGLDRIDIAYIHDPDDYFEVALREAYPVLHELREAGVLRAIGAGMNQWQMLAQFVERCDVDVVLLAGRYTLLDRSAAATFLPLCARRRVAVVAAGVFNSGILAQAEPNGEATYNYVPAPPAILARASDGARVRTLRYSVDGGRYPIPAAPSVDRRRITRHANGDRSRHEQRASCPRAARRFVGRTRRVRCSRLRVLAQHRCSADMTRSFVTRRRQGPGHRRSIDARRFAGKRAATHRIGTLP